eukprot:1088612-Rhodomonas_salina.6
MCVADAAWRTGFAVPCFVASLEIAFSACAGSELSRCTCSGAESLRLAGWGIRGRVLPPMAFDSASSLQRDVRTSSS